MPRFVSKDGKHTVETSVATEAAELRRDGYTEQKAKTAAVRETDAENAAKPTK
ncbi:MULTISPECIES: hypothetical protein [Arthrobacter]|uniref:hypothetical protein n=1 Tax=Arthrobacter TaxID=1663 RepID=UPI0014044EB0|nr:MULTISPECIES: hypothetical protein [Arthrobacter]MBT8162794.1 hypothetical protein [Arthrobacter sp. GN70]